MTLRNRSIRSPWRKRGHGASVVLILFLPLIFIGCAQPLVGARSVETIESGIPVRFVYTDDGAKEVCLAGSFNQWSLKSLCMVRDGNTWSRVVPLPPGRYQYVFVIDGHRWKPDPGALITEETGFGTRNSVLIVE